jgi:hypothetical protein
MSPRRTLYVAALLAWAAALAPACSSEETASPAACIVPTDPRRPGSCVSWEGERICTCAREQRFVVEADIVKDEAGTTRAVELPNDRVGYVSAISIGPLCLTCHGTAIDPAVKARLDEKYPHDQATGYGVGDVRGVFWAELPAR